MLNWQTIGLAPRRPPGVTSQWGLRQKAESKEVFRMIVRTVLFLGNVMPLEFREERLGIHWYAGPQMLLVKHSSSRSPGERRRGSTKHDTCSCKTLLECTCLHGASCAPSTTLAWLSSATESWSILQQ
eukprot:809779-Pelagomonas_calceolata.AAC.1